MFCNYLKLSEQQEIVNIRSVTLKHSFVSLSHMMNVIHKMHQNRSKNLCQSAVEMGRELEQIHRQETSTNALSTLIKISNFTSEMKNSSLIAAILCFILLTASVVDFTSEIVDFYLFLILLLYNMFGSMFYAYGVYQESKLHKQYRKLYGKLKNEFTNYRNKQRIFANRLLIDNQHIQCSIEQLRIDCNDIQTQLDAFQNLQKSLEILQHKHQVLLFCLLLICVSVCF